jgi:probable F420-dependent oxidoreductase
MRLGLAVPLEAIGLSASLDLARDAEALGYDDVWSSEVAGPDGFTPLAALAATTSRVRLGLALAPAFTRPPALLAMSAAALQEISGGRFVLGVGASSPAIVGSWMGTPYDRPRTRVRETVEALQLILSGEKTTYAGETLEVHGFRLGTGASWVPIQIGALGPRMFELAGELGDGVLISLGAAHAIPRLLERFHAGARVAGRDPAGLEVWCRVLVAADEEGPEVEAMLRRFLVGYGTVPAYNAHLARQGYAEEAAAMVAAWTGGRRADATAAVSDRLLRGLVAFGSAQACVEHLRAYRQAGVTTLVIDPVSAAADPAERMRRVRATVTTVLEGLR